MGDKDKAFDWMEKAYREQDVLMTSFIRGLSSTMFAPIPAMPT